jgi:prepilin-type N-terminal cleavage/methylation domain-containing protein
MIRSPRSRAPRGFSLIELMIVVAIIGLISSMAVPAYDMLIKRVKTAERGMVLRNLELTIKDYYLNNDDVPGGGEYAYSDYNPPLPVTGKKKEYVKTMPVFKDISYRPDGPVYFHYQVLIYNYPQFGLRLFGLTAIGDLDQDGRYTYAYKYFYQLPQSGEWWEYYTYESSIADD